MCCRLRITAGSNEYPSLIFGVVIQYVRIFPGLIMAGSKSTAIRRNTAATTATSWPDSVIVNASTANGEDMHQSALRVRLEVF